MTSAPASTSSDTATTERAVHGSRLRRWHEKGLAPVAVIVVLVAVIGAYDNSFFGAQSIMSLFEQTAPLALLAIAQGFVILTGRITLANAALASLAGVVLARTLGTWGPTSVVVVLVGATLCGVLIGWLHVTTQVPSFIVTLGFLGLFAGISLAVSKADSFLVTQGYGSIEWIFLRLYGFPISFLLVLLVTGLLMVVLKVLPWGREIKAIGLNERAAAFSGVRTNRVVVTVFALSGLLSGLAAVFQVSQLQSAGATTSDSLLLPSIAAVIVGGSAISGGVGGVGRTLCGALVIALLRVGLDLVGVDSAFQPILYGVIVILAIAATVDRRRGATVA